MTHENMTNIIAAGKIGSATGASVMLAQVITGTSSVSVEVILGLATFAFGIVWWSGRKFQQLEDGLDKLNESRQRDVAEITRRLDSLPCSPGPCEKVKS